MALANAHVLIVHRDEADARELAQRLKSDGCLPTVVRTEEAAHNVLSGAREVHGLIADLRVSDINGLRLLDIAVARNPGICAIMIADRANIELATEAMRRGAYDFQIKPIIYTKLKAVLERGFLHQELVSEVEDLRGKLDEHYGFSRIVGNSPAIITVLDRIRQIAPTRTTVLIYGETGTGKELAARAIHDHSPVSRGPFVTLNCAALSESLVESELFGHEKGAFTSAVAARAGRFESANGGSLFLDEVAEISPAVQVKLLRVLEEGEIERVGSNKPVKVDARLLAATNVRLEEKVKRGEFRSDLYYRLRVAEIPLPPLRARREDIPLLVNSFIKDFNEMNARGVTGLTRDALQMLMRYDWPGNVRELRNCVEGMAVFAARRRRLGVADVPDYVKQAPSTEPELHFRIGTSLREVEKATIETTLRQVGFDKKEAARVLGIALRTVYKKMEDDGIRR